MKPTDELKGDEDSGFEQIWPLLRGRSGALQDLWHSDPQLEMTGDWSGDREGWHFTVWESEERSRWQILMGLSKYESSRKKNLKSDA